MCRGDLSSENCFNCIDTASQAIMKNCTNQKEAVDWPPGDPRCIARCSNRFFFGTMETWQGWDVSFTPDITTNVDEFDQALNTLIDKLAAYVTGSTKRSNLGMKLAIGISAGVAMITVVSTVTICYLGKEFFIGKAMVFWKKKTTNYYNVEAFIRSHGSLAPKQYYYSDVKRFTNSFVDKLGQGGYGGVYKGKLSDGRLVAVKLLSETKGNGEEFINEVASISRTSHINVVTLLGFCFERNKRALIYEFMPNGSLDKFIYNDESLNTNCRLEWKVLYQIAVGIARGLEYLHRGCNTRIVHFDIKPHNILLDEDFCPKISDFGLAKLCKRKESIVSMLGARGTAGYIAPEVFCRNFGRVSHKSDVYSYGIMLLEMVGVRKKIEVGVVRSSEVYFPDWIYDHIEHGEDLRLYGVTTEEEEEIARKMILVGLSCIHTNPSDRPSMMDLLSYAWKNWNEGTVSNLLDPTLRTVSSSINEIMRCIHIGLLCVQENVANRPTVASIVLMFSSFSLTLPVPSEPAFFMHSSIDPEMPLLREDYSGATNTNSSQSKTRSAHLSVNEASITELYPR
ncbi:hypothetical protein F0562_018932 [Nyssa sinensis]|uniref:Protein kinase domain-containing protein n=1 Tax=Nyssa sinensis TaxID=561372 RepID=A0A5J4ZDS2_9ASTE|nr:hypothetical protein F0562_018932 [Nyssa sinensis]